VSDSKKFLLISLGILFLLGNNLFAEEALFNNPLTAVLNVQKYERSIHIMAMLLLGFGFLMVFVRKYGRSSLTATFLLVSVSLPIYLLVTQSGKGSENTINIDELILAEFAAASLLITAGAVLGRIKMHQYMVLGALFVPCYILNEWLVLKGGMGLIPVGGVADTGGSIVIHAFGAIFGLGVAFSSTTKEQLDMPIESDATSDRYSMLGSMVLWIFWPSFCAALVPPELIPTTIFNVILALCGSTIATYFVSVIIRRKICLADIANAALAGGVAIGSTCDQTNYMMAIVIGLIAGSISTIGFSIIQSKQQKLMRLIDSCGVTNLHGIPGLFGGLAAIPLVKGLSIGNQLSGIGITIVVAVITGLIAGKILSLFGKTPVPYDDAVEFMDASE
jgi:ammonium transporter Rh